MKIDEKHWATLGRVLTILTVIATAVGLISKFSERFSNPSITGTATVRESCVSPQIRAILQDGISGEQLSKLIHQQVASGVTAAKVLQSVQNELSDTNELFGTHLNSQLTLRLPSYFLEAQIVNNGSEVAHDVRLVMPGQGKADILDLGYPKSDVTPISWSGSIPLGDIRPGGVMNVRVWDENTFGLMVGLATLKPAVSYSNKTFSLRQMQVFYGWDADLVAWFLALGLIGKAAILLLVTGVCFVVIRSAINHGYIVLRPQKIARIQSETEAG